MTALAYPLRARSMETPEMETSPELGLVLKKRRLQAKLTLDALARKSSVSKSMLSQIERGEANPSFSVLWRLTRALGMSLTELVGVATGETGQPGEMMTAAGTPRISNDEGTCQLRILSPPRLVDRIHWYDIEVEAGGALVSKAHAPGCWEHLSPLNGSLVVDNSIAVLRVEEGGTARYVADVPHTISNESDRPVRALLVTVYPW